MLTSCCCSSNSFKETTTILLFVSVSWSSVLWTTSASSSICGCVHCDDGNSTIFFVRMSLLRTTGSLSHSSTGLKEYSVLVPGRSLFSRMFCSTAMCNPLRMVLRSQPVRWATLSADSVNVPPDRVWRCRD